MNNERTVRLAAQLYQCRAAARQILGDQYHERMDEYGRVIRGVAAERCIGLLEAGQEIAKSAGDSYAVVLIMAAVVEAIEPADEGPPKCGKRIEEKS